MDDLTTGVETEGPALLPGMTRYIVTTPYLDECGAVYLPACGEGGDCVRLAEAASQLWRILAAGQVPADDLSSSPEARAFLDELVRRGAVQEVNP